jgi:hypothetical protein
MPLLPPEEQTTTRTVALSGGSLLKNKDAVGLEDVLAEGESGGSEAVQHYYLLAGL